MRHWEERGRKEHTHFFESAHPGRTNEMQERSEWQYAKHKVTFPLQLTYFLLFLRCTGKGQRSCKAEAILCRPKTRSLFLCNLFFCDSLDTLRKADYTSQAEQSVSNKRIVNHGTPYTRLLFPCNLLVWLSQCTQTKEWLCPLCSFSTGCLKWLKSACN